MDTDAISYMCYHFWMEDGSGSYTLNKINEAKTMWVIKFRIFDNNNQLISNSVINQKEVLCMLHRWLDAIIMINNKC